MFSFSLIQAPFFFHCPREVRQIFDLTQTLQLTNHDQHLILVTTQPPPHFRSQMSSSSRLELGAGVHAVLLKMLLLSIQASLELVKVHCKGFAAMSSIAIQKCYGQKVGMLGDFISFPEYYETFCPLHMRRSPRPAACNKKDLLIREHCASHISIEKKKHLMKQNTDKG